MKRVVNIEETKYLLEKEYGGFGIYNEVCPSGLRVSQSYMITNDFYTIVCDSYNNLIVEELLDKIDSYKEKGKFGLKVIKKDNYYIVHPSGTNII